MTEAMVIRGRYIDQTFVPDEPLPAVEGAAQLIDFPNTPHENPSVTSIVDLIGKAPLLRAAEDITTQVQEERNAWDEP